MDTQTSQRYDPTEPLHKIDEGLEEPDDVWLEDEVVEPTVKPEQRPVINSGDNSPLERLIQSISSDGDQWALEEERDAVSPLPTRLSTAKTYYDPTKTERSDIVEEEEGDSDDEINLSPKEPTVENPERTEATFTGVMLFRFLFGKKGMEDTKKQQVTQDQNNKYNMLPGENENHAAREEPDDADSDTSSDSSGVLTADENEETVLTSKKETAENLPLFLLGKVKNLLSKDPGAEEEEKPANCPLCGQDLSGISHDEFSARMKQSKMERVAWADQKYAMMIKPPPEEVYKTELRIGADGSQSITESYYRRVTE